MSSRYSGRGRDRGTNRGGHRGNFQNRGQYQGSTMPYRNQQDNVPTIYLDGQATPRPDQDIVRLEDTLILSTKGQEYDEIPGRVGYGSKGVPMILRTNHFAMEIKSGVLYRYDVNFTPQLSKQKARRFMKRITQGTQFQGRTWATDYASIIVTTAKLDDAHDEWSDRILFDGQGNVVAEASLPPDVPDFVRQARARNQAEFIVRYQGSYDLRDLLTYLRRDNEDPAEATNVSVLDYVQLLNIAITKLPRASPSVVNVGQNQFYPLPGHPEAEVQNLGKGLEAYRGYFASVRSATGRLLLNINVTCGTFYKALPLPALLKEAELKENEKAERFIRLLKVHVAYPAFGSKPAVTRTKRILGFARLHQSPVLITGRFSNADQVKFRRAEDVPWTSVTNHFLREHGLKLQRPNLPVLNVGTQDEPQFVPPELCMVVSGQAYRSLLDPDQTKTMLQFAARPPQLNAMSIAGTPRQPGRGLRLFGLANVGGATSFGCQVNTSMITVPARLLGAPQIQYADKKTVNPFNGSWNSMRQKFVSPGKLGRWKVLVINRPGWLSLRTPQGSHDNFLAPEDLFNQVHEMMGATRVDIGSRGNTESIVYADKTPEDIVSTDARLDRVFAKATEHKFALLFIVLPAKDAWIYSRIKYYGDIKYGIHTINIVGSTLQKSRGPDTTLGNLALKFNVKGKGVCHNISNTFLPPLDTDTMVVGIDVTHPSPGSSDDAPSISAVVASVDEQLFQWPGGIRKQEARQEMVQELKEMVLERLRIWRRRHSKLPKRVLVYRDGVSEGQYPLVLEKELPAFYEAFSELFPANTLWPKLAYIVVGKRHHVRFYPTKAAETADRSANPRPGTIVDRGIAGRRIREFWLQAHHGLQGTAKPAHYVVLKDEIGFQADELEQFTHNMCYLFNRATKSISVCPPVYYADLLCERGRVYLHSKFVQGSSGSENDPEWTGGVHPNLAESTWYI